MAKLKVMDIDAFRQSLAAEKPPSGATRLIQALWHDAKGEWHRAHEIAQSVKGKAGARVHAYLHRKEGDLDNANYWHERAGTEMPKVALEQEWETLVETLINQSEEKQ